jgi:hypothetical protein
MAEKEKIYKILAGMSEREKPLGRPRHKWEDEMDLEELWCEGT